MMLKNIIIRIGISQEFCDHYSGDKGICKDTLHIGEEMVATYGRKKSQRNKGMSKCFFSSLFSRTVFLQTWKIKLNCIFTLIQIV